MGGEELSPGRRVAQWRVRRRLTQQMLADRLGKSKSWVDKVERGARALDRFSVIQDIARVLRVEPAALLGPVTGTPSTAAALDLEPVRAALARYDVFRTCREARPATGLDEAARQVEHAWLTYQHAHYPQLVRLLPGLLDTVRRLPADRRPEPLVETYRLTSAVLVKLGEADLGWLAADRAVAVAGDDPLLAATAAVPLAAALRTVGRPQLARTAALTAARRIAPSGVPAARPVCGTLLLQAALAAAAGGDDRSVRDLLDRAAGLAARIGDGADPYRTGFGPAVVEVTGVVAAVELGDAGEAVRRHETVVRGTGWQRLPVERRAAHLVDAARAYLQVGDVPRAGRALIDANRIAPGEVRCRPVARTVIEAVARGGPAPAGVAELAALVGLTR
ncbi:helix-turn-helix domain-containing protein [Micromonospora fulviviridis]|uniref:Helix-turn-helix transcriptional regulator n=1 Tax=Micromonospora fulviviridis TaxID=47860 RepID=A0ABV2VNL1_9ACTN